MARPSIFYSWQSDLANGTNRTLIGRCLERAAEKVSADEALQVDPVVERDTKGVAGSPDISKTIFEKIDRCTAFVADVSLITPPGSERPSPNPNVLIELGYAIAKHGAERVILVQNTAFGGPESLPFDLRARRVLTYSASEDGGDRSTARDALSRSLEAALRAILETSLSSEAIESSPESLLRVVEAGLHDPAQQIKVHSAVVSAANDLLATLGDVDLAAEFDGERLKGRLAQYEEWSTSLEEVFVLIGRWSEGGADKFLVDVLERLAYLPVPAGPFNPAWNRLQSYPALRLLYCCGISAFSAGHFACLHSVLSVQVWNQRRDKHQPICFELTAPDVLPRKTGMKIPGRDLQYTPLSNHLHETLRPSFGMAVPNDAQWDRLFDRFEFFYAMVVAHDRLKAGKDRFWMPPGRFAWSKPGIAHEFLAEAERDGDDWPPLRAGFFDGRLSDYVETSAAAEGFLGRLHWD